MSSDKILVRVSGQRSSYNIVIVDPTIYSDDYIVSEIAYPVVNS